jgi:hypothetical protein
MGTSPGCRCGHKVMTPELLGTGAMVAAASGNHHCLKNGQNADSRAGGYPVREQVKLLMECGTKAHPIG